MKYRYVKSPFGRVVVAGDGARLEWLAFTRGPNAFAPPPYWSEDAHDGLLRDVSGQLEEYFRGERERFDVPLNPQGTPFQVSVWEQLIEIPYGTTVSYGELARRLGRPEAFRAVGAANGQNPISIIIPCHRVLGKNGHLTGYGGGLETKRGLLDLELHRRGKAFRSQQEAS